MKGEPGIGRAVHSMLLEKLLEIISQHHYKPLTVEELAHSLQIPRRELQEFREAVDGFIKDGTLFMLANNRIALPEKFGIITGTLTVNQRGFGFVTRGADERDAFIPPTAMADAMHGDRVQVKILREDKKDKKAEGEIIRVVERKNTTVIGTYQESRNFGFVAPEDVRLKYDIFIPKSGRNFAELDDVVVVDITKWPEKGRNPEGVISEILGKKGDKGVDILTVVKKYALPEEFPPKVYEQAERLSEVIPKSEIARRRDLRNQMIMTIDGADAKDLDDAVIVEKRQDGTFRLGVHIADVTHYVREGTPVDSEAFKRATSVYLLDLVIPMLPKKLSNNLCSLNPHEPKLTLSCEMTIDRRGKVIDYDIFESVIESKLRATYEDVTRVLKGEMDEGLEKYREFIPMLKDMEELQGVLKAKRDERGAIDFDFPESKIVLDKLGKPIYVGPYPREISNRMIEEFMLVCNETVAEHMFWTRAPFIYRVHEEPDGEKLKAFSEFAFNLGIPVRLYSGVQPKSLQEVLEKVKGKSEELILSKLLLRSMMQARYSPESVGHFGLAATYYCHFTSPIRRYPDLMIHRIIKEFINQGIPEGRAKELSGIVAEASKISSDMERVADEAERDLDSLKKAEYMNLHMGETFEGIISSVTGFGIFVELPNTIEGLIHITSLYDDYYLFDDRHMKLRGESNGREFGLGDKVNVLVSKVDLDSHDIFFELPELIADLLAPDEIMTTPLPGRKSHRNGPKPAASAARNPVEIPGKPKQKAGFVTGRKPAPTAKPGKSKPGAAKPGAKRKPAPAKKNAPKSKP